MNASLPALVNGSTGAGQEAPPLFYKDILLHYEQSLRMSVRHYVQQNQALDDNTKALLLFLRGGEYESLPTVRTYTVILCSILNHTRKPFHQIRREDLDGYLDTLKRSGKKPATTNTKLAVLRSFFRFLASARLIPVDISWGMKNVKDPKPYRHDEKILTEPEVKAIIDYARKNAPRRDYVILKFLFYSGLRASEVCRLCWKDLRPDISGEKWFLDVLGKGSKRRDVYLPKALVKDLMDYRQEIFGVEPYRSAPPLDAIPLFFRRRGAIEPLGRELMLKLVRTLGLAALGKKISPHWCRHTFATHACNRGVRLELIRDQLGHGSVKTTEIYEKSRHVRNEHAGMVFEEDADTNK